MAKCLIAGLPSAGKSTYIGVLAYLLSSPVKGQILRFSENPDDLSYLNRLSEPWLSQRIVDRTTLGSSFNIDFQLKRSTDDETICVQLPDIAGEDFVSMLKKQSEIVRSWSEKPDSLLFFIRECATNILAEQFGEEDKTGNAKGFPNFEVNSMSLDIQNVLLLKELHNLFPWKKLAIGISSWDLFTNDYPTPSDFLRQSPFLYNFIKHYFADAMIFGISAQGAEYNNSQELVEELEDRTIRGERAYIVTDKGEKSYDLTLPLNFLIS